MVDRNMLLALPKEELVGLIEDAAKNWLAHDGLWFLAVESAHSMDEAIRLDAQAWEQFTVVEARRILRRLGLAPGGGLPALKEALQYRLYAYLNEQEIEQPDDRTLIFRMRDCRVQAARTRDGRPDFPCKPVGLVEYAGFARTVDPRIVTRCLCCPPDAHPADCWCAWEFTVPA
jgi:hypothetical protein